MEMFPFERAAVKCVYCGFIASSAYELLTRHSCYRAMRSRNVAQRSSGIYKPNVMNRTLTQNLRSFRLPSTRQTNVNDILKNVKNDEIANLSKVHYGFRSPVISSQSQQSSWDEILDESEIPIPVLELNKKNEFLNARNSSLRNEENSTPKPVIIYQKFPPKLLERASSPILLHQLLEKPNTDYHFKKTFLNTEASNMNVATGSQLVSEPTSEPTHVMLISPNNKEITIVSLDDVINELEKRIEELPYEIRLRLEYEFLQDVQNAVDKEQKRTLNTV